MINKEIKNREIRKLIYQEKTFEEFGIQREDTLNHIIYYVWLIKRTEIDPFDANSNKHYLKAFNDAYFICTLALLTPVGRDLAPSKIIEFVDKPSIVFPMVHLYLSKLVDSSHGIKCFLDKLETKFKIEPDWEQNYNELQQTVCNYDGSIEPCNFVQRNLTKEMLSCIDWYQMTNSFKKDAIEAVVINYARTNEAWHLMCEAIKECAQKIDFEQNDDYYFDDEGNINYYQTLKSKGVYQFCDELAEKYTELAVKAQSLAIGNDSCIERDYIPANNENINRCFKFPSTLVRQTIKSAVEECCKNKATYALLEVTLYDHGLLCERTAHTLFLRALIDWGILSGITEDELNKMASSMSDKTRHLPTDGYMSWDGRSKSKLECKKIGEIIEKIMPYSSQ